MSVRIYTGRHADRGGSLPPWAPYVPWALLALGITAQILWVLTSDGLRTALTIVSVLSFFGASTSHALQSRRLMWTVQFLGISLGLSYLVELLGVTTQFPFGSYTYSGALGPALFGVPLLIPLAWAGMAYPCLLAAQRLAADPLTTTLIGGVLFAAWDLFLDPQMVSEGYWTWSNIGWYLPGIEGIPLQNFLGWLLTAFLLIWLLDRLPRRVSKDGAPAAMLSWIYLSNVLAALVFFDRVGVALWGGIIMGAIIIPWWWRSWSQPQW
ncbi:MAG: carotenoid biosynthesis protein [Actinomycetota bacterium]|nr:carotenoid biosynthesis protein [Actinomycetota bacterium]